MSLFFHEPFGSFDRFIDETLSPVYQVSRRVQPEQRQENGGVVRAFQPRMDLHEDAEKNLVSATFELPGLKKEDVQIDVHNNRLTVSAESNISQEHNENGYAIRERRFGKISRTLQLPQGVKDEEIKASMENGVLTVTFPKTSAELAPKKITIA